MKDKHLIYGLAILVGLVALFVGLGLGAYYFSTSTTIEKTVTKEVPVNVVVEKEVIKEVPLKLVSYRDLATKELLNYLDDEDLLECNDESYDLDQVKVSKNYDSYIVTNIDDKDAKYSVEASVKLKYLDVDTEEKCYQIYDFKVTYEADEDTEVEIL